VNALPEMARLQSSDDYKRYKDLKPEQKIELIFSDKDLADIEAEYEKIDS